MAEAVNQDEVKFAGLTDMQAAAFARRNLTGIPKLDPAVAAGMMS